MAVLLAVVSMSAAASMDYTDAEGWFVDPITVKVMHDRRVPFASSSKRIDVAGMRGECERVQIWGWRDDRDLADVALAFTDLKLTSTLEHAVNSNAVFSKEHWTYKQQGFVNTSTPTHYNCIEDILTHKRGPYPPVAPPPLPGTECNKTPFGHCWTGCPAVQKNWSSPKSCGGVPNGQSCNQCNCNVLNTSCGDSHASAGHACLPGWYPDPLLDVDPAKGVPLIEMGFTQPIYVEVCIPYGQTAGNYSGKFEITAASDPLLTVPVALEVWAIDLPRLNDTGSFNTAFNFNSNMSSWYPEGTKPETWWADWLGFLAHHRVPGDSIYLHAPRPLEEYKILAANGAKWMGMGDAGISFRPPANGTVPSGYVESWIEKLTPTMTSLDSLGLLNKTYVYGFDEMPEVYNESVYEIFGGLKNRWPDLTTMAVLDWETFPSDLPLDIWVDEYADYGKSKSYLVPTAKEKLRQGWLASKATHQFWWYWCIGPEDPRGMNTFIERPAIEARLLYWLTALHAVNGMLYYDVAIWSGQCPAQRECKAVGRINETGLTDFEPATFPSPKPGSTNGDGSFTYPGEGGKPLGSIRLSNIADGIEDWELFNKLGSTSASISNAADLISRLVTNETSRNEDPSLLERLRREAAHRVMAAD